MRKSLLILLVFLAACNSKNPEITVQDETVTQEEELQENVIKENDEKEEVTIPEPEKEDTPPKEEKTKEVEQKVEQGIGVIQEEHKIKAPVNTSGHNAEKDLLTGQLSYAKSEHFTKVDAKYCNKTIYLQNATYAAFLEMAKAAKKDGVKFTIISGARNFNHQKSIWERKWNKSTIQNPEERALDILKYSSMPMTSRHHWGTDLDLNSLNNSYFTSGQGLKVYQWLQKNAADYGFCQVYTNKSQNGRTGYNMEKWHWSYMPLSSKYLKKYNQLISYEDYNGFQGSETATTLQVIDNYVNGVGCE